MPFKSLAHYIL